MLTEKESELKENLGIPRMRTIQQCAAYFKEQDPGCCVGEWCIRQLVNQGKIPVRRTGKKFLINLDLLIKYFAEGTTKEGGID